MKKLLIIIFSLLALIVCKAQSGMCPVYVIHQDCNRGVEQESYVDGFENGYAYVDLGLPSGTKWSTKDFPSEYLYKWLGDIYKYCYPNPAVRTSEIPIEQDVIRKEMGGRWRIPSESDFFQLLNYCYWESDFYLGGETLRGFIVYKAKDDSDRGKMRLRLCEDENSNTPTASYSLADAHIYIPLHKEGYWSRTAASCSEAYYLRVNIDSYGCPQVYVFRDDPTILKHLRGVIE